MRQRKSYYIVDKIEITFKTLQEIKTYIESSLNPLQYLCCYVHKYNKDNEQINTYYIEVSKRNKVTFK